MDRDHELWACALQVIKHHGENANRFVAERIGALAMAGDANGITRWKAIAARMDQLRDGSLQ